MWQSVAPFIFLLTNDEKCAISSEPAAPVGYIYISIGTYKEGRPGEARQERNTVIAPPKIVDKDDQPFNPFGILEIDEIAPAVHNREFDDVDDWDDLEDEMDELFGEGWDEEPQ